MSPHWAGALGESSAEARSGGLCSELPAEGLTLLAEHGFPRDKCGCADPTHCFALRWVHGPTRGTDGGLLGSLRPVPEGQLQCCPAGFYTGWLLPAAAVGTLVFLAGCFLVFSDIPT